MQNRDFNRVEYDQTASHLHHASEHGIQLPANFDMVAYNNMSKVNKIKYAKKMVPRETIIAYQNKLAQAISLSFEQNSVPVRGFAGTRKADVGLVFQTLEPPPVNEKVLMMSIIKDNGQHISSYSITREQFDDILNNEFWVLRKQPFN